VHHLSRSSITTQLIYRIDQHIQQDNTSGTDLRQALRSITTTNEQPNHYHSNTPNQVKMASTNPFFEQPSTPQQAYIHPTSNEDFLPGYEAAMNDELRKWKDPEAQAYVADASPSPFSRCSKQKNKQRFWCAVMILGGIAAATLIASGLIGLMMKSRDHQVSSPNTLSITASMTETQTDLQILTVHVTEQIHSLITTRESTTSTQTEWRTLSPSSSSSSSSESTTTLDVTFTVSPVPVSISGTTSTVTAPTQVTTETISQSTSSTISPSTVTVVSSASASTDTVTASPPATTIGSTRSVTVDASGSTLLSPPATSRSKVTSSVPGTTSTTTGSLVLVDASGSPVPTVTPSTAGIIITPLTQITVSGKATYIPESSLSAFESASIQQALASISSALTPIFSATTTTTSIPPSSSSSSPITTATGGQINDCSVPGMACVLKREQDKPQVSERQALDFEGSSKISQSLSTGAGEVKLGPGQTLQDATVVYDKSNFENEDGSIVEALQINGTGRIGNHTTSISALYLSTIPAPSTKLPFTVSSATTVTPEPATRPVITSAPVPKRHLSDSETFFTSVFETKEDGQQWTVSAVVDIDDILQSGESGTLEFFSISANQWDKDVTSTLVDNGIEKRRTVAAQVTAAPVPRQLMGNDMTFTTVFKTKEDGHKWTVSAVAELDEVIQAGQIDAIEFFSISGVKWDKHTTSTIVSDGIMRRAEATVAPSADRAVSPSMPLETTFATVRTVRRV
jgi:hypothetical protein